MTGARRRWPARTAWIALILLAGLGLRLWGIGFGLPELYHIDEQTTVNVALKMAATRDANPHYFFHPHVLHYLLLGLYGAAYLIGHIGGLWQTAGDFQRLFVTDPTLFYLLGRLLGAAFGTLTLYLTYRLGKQLWSARVGLWAAGVLAVCFLHVRSSHYARHDIPVTCVIVLCLWWWSRVRWGRPREWFTSGFVTGLAIATNWNAALLVPWSFAWMAAAQRRPQSPAWWVKAVATIGIGILTGVGMGSPFVLLAVPEAVQGVLPVLRRAGTLPSSITTFGSQPNWLVNYPRDLWVGVGGLPLLLGIGGLAWVVWKGTPFQRLVGWFVVSYYVLISQVPLAVVEYIIPILPLLCLTAAVAFWMAVERLTGPGWKRCAMAAGLTGLITLWSVVQSAAHDWLLTQADTRTLAKQWVETHLPEGTRIGVEAYTVVSAWVPRLAETPEQQRQILAHLQGADPSAGRLRSLQLRELTPTVSYTLIDISPASSLDERFANAYDFNRLLEQGAEYAIISSYWVGCRSDPGHPVERRFYEALRSQASVEAEFSPFRPGVRPFFDVMGAHTPFRHVTRLSRPGPVITIYRLPQT